MTNLFKALRIEEKTPNQFSISLKSFSLNDLPDSDVLIKVHYSSLNYKDALSASGNRGITKNYPHTPGIDAAGVVISDKTGTLKNNQQVLVTGYDLGMNTWGGLSEYISVPVSWVVPLPEGLTLKDAMIYGTSGFTAAQGLYHILQNEVPKGPCLVTGARGAVGSMAIALLAHQGHQVAAMTRSEEQRKELELFGASEIVLSEEALKSADRPLLKAKWNAVIETVGGRYLSYALRSTQYRGIVTCCGMIDSPELHVSVFPFILRGVKLIGLDSAECPLPMKKEIWQRLATEWKPQNLNHLATEIGLSEVPMALEKILNGKGQGKIVVKITES